MKKIYLYLIVILILMVLGYFLGTKIAGGIGFILAVFGLGKTKRLKEAKERINEAGEDIEATKHDADSALKFFDDFFSDSDSK